MLYPELALPCSVCCQGCWDSQLPPTLPHPEAQGAQPMALAMFTWIQPQETFHTACSRQLCQLHPCSLLATAEHAAPHSGHKGLLSSPHPKGTATNHTQCL